MKAFLQVITLQLFPVLSFCLDISPFPSISSFYILQTTIPVIILSPFIRQLQILFWPVIHIIFTYLQEFCLVGSALFSFSLTPHMFLDISFILLIPFYCSAIHQYWKMWMILLCSCLYIQYSIIHRCTASHPTHALLVTWQRWNKCLLLNSSISSKAIFRDIWPFSYHILNS